jgi:hypothetical protein
MPTVTHKSLVINALLWTYNHLRVDQHAYVLSIRVCVRIPRSGLNAGTFPTTRNGVETKKFLEITGINGKAWVLTPYVANVPGRIFNQ